MSRNTLRLWPRMLVLGLLIATVILLGTQFGSLFSIEALASREKEFLAFGQQHVVLIAVALFALYVAVTASSFPAATALTFLTAWLFKRLFGPVNGFVAAVAFVSFASSAGATIALLISRYLLRGAVRQRYGKRIAKIDETFRRDGKFYLISLRLTPFVPFWFVNLAMGLTSIRARTFWWVSQIGMLPASLIFVFAGMQVPSLAELERKGPWEILWPGPFIALVVLAFAPWLTRWVSRQLGFGDADLKAAPSSESSSDVAGRSGTV